MPKVAKKGRIRLPKGRKEFVIALLSSAVFAAIIGAAAKGIIDCKISQDRDQTILQEEQWVVNQQSAIRNLINLEANLTLNRQIAEVISLYTYDAFIMDAAKGNANLQVIWQGNENITKRYQSLTEFTKLKHAGIEISIKLDKFHATATAGTVGAYIDNDVEVPIASHNGEYWEFTRIDETWKITGFTYNLP